MCFPSTWRTSLHMYIVILALLGLAIQLVGLILLLTLATVHSIPPSPHRRLLDLEGDGASCRSRRGAAREGSRAAERRTEMAEQQREAAPRRDEWRRNEWWRTRESPGGD